MSDNTGAAGDEGGFAALLADLELMAKAMPAKDDKDDTDATIAAAAADGDTAGEGNQDQPQEDPDDDGEDGETFGKSFEVTLADGTKAEALDGTAMMKSLHAENVALRGRTDEMGSALLGMGALMKSMHAAQIENVKLIKSLRSDVAKLGVQGSGRKAVLNVAEKNPAPVTNTAPTKHEIMAKAHSLQAEGKLSGADANRVFAYAERGLGIPEGLASLFTA